MQAERTTSHWVLCLFTQAWSVCAIDNLLSMSQPTTKTDGSTAAFHAT
ncbi:hypothetical protein EGR_00725 [Echinococcus granulosus]|uniref:Uncharacterized protein n=1 Tax=Echinococcus granulosus TaxID=6210 RepID=W6UU61_ECHGR|nr:hypothetical protein EGR_00725 [Echinococcus granulosus]EUB64181.1 hypothetical protein EGR_00725 [Echinococcus granulosus]